MIHFPAFCIDNFYKDPDMIREYALSLDYCVTHPSYPGKRTMPLHDIDKEFFDKFCRKLLSVFYDYSTEIEWVIQTHFQIIEPLSSDKNDVKNIGWIHADGTLFGGIIYLNPKIDLNCGTSIFNLTTESEKILNEDSEKFWKDYEDTNKHKEAFYGEDKDDGYDEMLHKNNSMFTETVRFNNVYNRLVGFDGTTFHSANSMYTENEPRLTQVFFVKEIKNRMNFPLNRIRMNEL